LKKYFVHQGNKTWINVLPKIIFSYNHSPHSGLNGMRPTDVYSTNNIDNWISEQKQSKMKKPKFKVGDHVRISKISASPFIKNFDNNWSDEVFQISEIDTNQTPVMYFIKDYENNQVSGKFYEQELQVIPAPTEFRIQKILKSKKDGKYKQYYVKWHGYETPTWISENQLIK